MQIWSANLVNKVAKLTIRCTPHLTMAGWAAHDFFLSSGHYWRYTYLFILVSLRDSKSTEVGHVCQEHHRLENKNWRFSRVSMTIIYAKLIRCVHMLHGQVCL